VKVAPFTPLTCTPEVTVTVSPDANGCDDRQEAPVRSE
jgi:hypothetical protein